jgi:hypothetical protein
VSSFKPAQPPQSRAELRGKSLDSNNIDASAEGLFQIGYQSAGEPWGCHRTRLYEKIKAAIGPCLSACDGTEYPDVAHPVEFGNLSDQLTPKDVHGTIRCTGRLDRKHPTKVDMPRPQGKGDLPRVLTTRIRSAGPAHELVNGARLHTCTANGRKHGWPCVSWIRIVRLSPHNLKVRNPTRHLRLSSGSNSTTSTKGTRPPPRLPSPGVEEKRSLRRSRLVTIRWDIIFTKSETFYFTIDRPRARSASAGPV